MKQQIFLFASVILFAASCKKDDAPQYNSNVKAPLTIEFDQVVGSSDMQLNTGNYTNAVGESFNITTCKYFISNIKLTRTDGSVYVVPQLESYFLIDESNHDSHEAELSVPEGEYKTLEFMVGVDSLRNTKDISERTGVLDPAGAAAGMYWSWNSGYIFFKLEGASPASAMGDYMYHIGGFGGYSSPTINNIKTVNIDLSARGVPKVKTGRSANVHLFVDVLKMFNGSTNISIASNPMVMFNSFSTTIANNYVAMFRHDHTEN